MAVALVVTAAWSVELAERRIWLAQEQARVDDIATALEQQAAADSAYLAAMGSLLGNFGNPSPNVFRSYVSQLHGISALNGVAGLGWVERFDASHLPALRQRMAQPPVPDTELPSASAGGKWPVYVISMLAPQTKGDTWSTHVDFGGDTPWVEVLDRATRSGAITTADWADPMTGEKAADASAFLVFAPARGLSEVGGFHGGAFILIRAGDFVHAAVSKSLAGGGRVELIRRTADGEVTIFRSRAGSMRLASPLEKNVSPFDQTWTLRYAPPVRAGLSVLSLVVLLGGTAFALLLLAYVLLVQRRTVDLHALLDAQLLQEKERSAFIRELNHRVKNTLANVTSIISLTRHRTTDVQIFADMLLQRVRALAAGHSLLEGAQWGPADLRAIFSTQLSVHDKSGERVELEGPDVLVAPNDALTIGLAVHELTTNSVRYGALSADEGRVRINWSVVDGNWVQVDWREEGGPPVETPEKLGFGLNVVQRALAHELHRPIELDFDPAGFRCRFFFQLREQKSFQFRTGGGRAQTR